MYVKGTQSLLTTSKMHLNPNSLAAAQTEMIIREGEKWRLTMGPLAPQHCDRGTHAMPTGHSQLSTSLAIYNYW